MAAPHSTDLSVTNSPSKCIVPTELVGTGLYILMEFIVLKRVDGGGYKVRSRNICTVALPLTSLKGHTSRIGGAQ